MATRRKVPATPGPTEQGPMMPVGGGESPQGVEPRGLIPSGSGPGASAPKKDDLSDDEMAQLERFHDNIMQGIGGGDTPEGQLSNYTKGLLEQPSETGPAGQIAAAAAEIVARALQGNLKKGVELSQEVVLVGAALVVDELAQIKEAMGDPLSDEEAAQALMAMWPMLFEQTASLGFWSEEDMAKTLEEVSKDPAQFDRDLKDVDPTGAEAMERIPPEVLAEDRQQPPMQDQAAGNVPPPPAEGAASPPTQGALP